MNYDLDCVIVNWNLKEDTLECIRSFLASGASPNQVIVVDNGSTDGSPQAIEEAFLGKVKIIRSDENLGFSAGYNLGIREALETNTSWILLLNNDTIVAPDFLEKICSTLQIAPSFDLFGPMILYASDPKRIWFLGDRLIPGLLATRGLYRNQIPKHPFPPLLEVDFLNGCAMLVNARVFQKVGLLDETLFMYGEEVDFCWRARQAGYRLAAVPGARLWHKISTSANREQARSRYLRTRNQMHFYRRYGQGLQKPAMVLFTLVRLLKAATVDLLHSQPGLVRPMIAGWIDGWRSQPVPKW